MPTTPCVNPRAARTNPHTPRAPALPHMRACQPITLINRQRTLKGTAARIGPPKCT